MAYQVLARRLRPQRFDEVVGQDHVTRTLVNAIKTDRLAHAFLFCGPRGVGKTTTARILAKCLNCETAADGPVPDPCNRCDSCAEIGDGRSLDVLEIDGASNRGIDEIRDLRENVRYAPSAGRAKVYIIDEVHMLTKEAFNALLKTLEEPPPNVYFVFATTEIHRVPATIRSRCQKYDFHRIASPVIEETLAKLATSESIEIDADALAELARQADGALRDAKSLLDQAVAVGEGHVTLDTLRELLGEAEDEVYLALAGAVGAGDTVTAFGKLAELLDRGLDPSRVAVSLTQTLRDLLVTRADAGQGEALGVRSDLAEAYGRVAGSQSAGKWTALLSLASRAVSELRRSPRPRLSLEVALACMSRLEDPGELAGLLGRLESLEGRLGGGSPPPGAPPPEVPAARREPPPRPDDEAASAPPPPARRRGPGDHVPPAPDPTDPGPAGAAGVSGGFTGAGGVPVDAETGRIWTELIGRVRGRKMMLASFLEHGTPVTVDGEALSAAFDSSYYEGMVGRRENLTVIQEELSSLAGKKLAFRIRKGVASPSGPKRGRPEPREERGAQPKDLLQENPGLARAIHELGGQLLPGGGSEPGANA